MRDRHLSCITGGLAIFSSKNFCLAIQNHFELGSSRTQKIWGIKIIFSIIGVHHDFLSKSFGSHFHQKHRTGSLEFQKIFDNQRKFCKMRSITNWSDLFASQYRKASQWDPCISESFWFRKILRMRRRKVGRLITILS